LIFYLLRFAGSNAKKVLGAFFVGFFFALSEEVFYLVSILISGDNFQLLFWRFFLVAPMHVVTSLIILFSILIDRRLVFLGIVIAAFIHYFFNVYVSSLMV